MTLEELEVLIPESERKAIAAQVIAELYPQLPKELLND